MDRTQEFFLFAEATNVPQKKPAKHADTSASLVAAIEEEVRKIEIRASQKKGVDQEGVAKAESSLHALYLQNTAEEDTEIKQNIQRCIRQKHAALTIRLASILREEQRRAALEEAEQAPPPRKGLSHTPGAQETMERSIHREEVSTIRRREMETIEMHINELGKMVTEVSMHISMQGERLERVDELFTGSRASIKKASFELNHALNAISQKRKTLFVAFGVLFGLLVLYAVY